MSKALTQRTLLLTGLAMLAFAGNSLLCRLALKNTPIDAISFTSLRLLAGALMLWLLLRWRNGGGQMSGNWRSAAALFTYAAAFSLAYVHLDSDGFSEKGDAAALKGGDDTRDLVLSTLGVRALKTFNVTDHQALDVSGTLGWQHNLSSVDAENHLAFANGNSAFNVQSVSLDRDAAVVGVRAGLALNRDVRVNLDYNGLIGSNEKDHGVGLTLDWQF